MNLFPEIERQDTASIKRFQEARLKETLEYLNANSPFYKKHFKKHNIDISRIKTLEDLRQIPVTTKDDIQKNNDDFLCVPRNRVIDYVTTSGTLGDPVTFAMTEKDLQRLAYNEAISFVCAGGESNDVYQLMTTIDRRFMAGLAYFMGIRLMGAGIVRVGGGIPELQWDSICRVNPTTIICVPSFILKLIEYAEKRGIDYRNTSVKKAVCIGEPLRNEDLSLNTLATRILEKWDLQLCSTYASTEMASAFTECSAGRGGHHHPELIIAEFLDDHDKPVPEGSAGELVFTTLGVEGMPLLRFKSGDLCHHYTDACSCGRSTMRVGPIIGRKKHMIKFKGTTLYPTALYDILDNVPEVLIYVVEVSTNSVGTDEIMIRIASEQAGEQLEKDLKDHFRARLRVSPTIKFETAEQLSTIAFPPTSRKPVKFIDHRTSKQA
jgi:phenylacetate-CoA ligase